MTTLAKLKAKFKSAVTPRKEAEFFAFLGNAAGVVKADNNNNVYITDYNGNVLKVYNEEVPPIPLRPVMVGYKNKDVKRLEVLRFVDAYPTARTIKVPNHADANHTWPNVDTLWVRLEQILSGIAIPESGMDVQFIGFIYYLNGFHLLNTHPIDFTSYIPTSGANYVLEERL